MSDKIEKDMKADTLDQAMGWAIDSLRCSTGCARRLGDRDLEQRLLGLEKKTITMLEGFRRELADKRDRPYVPRASVEPKLETEVI